MSDARLQTEAKRRGQRSGSRKTGKPVASSDESLEVTAPLFNAGELKVAFAAPAQLDDARAFELARLQMLGFFYFITYQDDLAVGHTWPGGFFPVHGTIKSDWGNPVHRAFMKETATWDYRFVLNSASGYYRAIIRRHPSLVCWSWAVEWNDAYRLVGFLGEEPAAQSVANLLPRIPVRLLKQGQNRWLRFRTEEPLGESEDTLFIVPDSDA